MAAVVGKPGGMVLYTIAVPVVAEMGVALLTPANSAAADAGLDVELCRSPGTTALKAIPEPPKDNSDPLAAVPVRCTGLIAAV